ncbi:MAG: hypothetical protein RL323_1822 [Pseudomonadota bacterium]|jgi:Tripartite tricarboxylate transporter TctB family
MIPAFLFSGDMQVVIKSQKDFVSGLMFMVTGAAFAIGSIDYSVGTAARMGPGYFPLILGVLLSILGLVVLFKSLGDTKQEGEAIGTIAWKPLFFVIGANLLFGSLLGGLPLLGLPAMGLVPAIVALVLMASAAGEAFKLREALVLASILALGSYLTFVKLLGLPFQLWPAFIAG